ncbi:MAG: signal peptidase II [Bacillota bacterium]|nr:signal peptidase II [Bacillota bacterium]
MTFIIGGALGNLIDRIRLNYVTDFLDFTLINYPIFNFADVFVVLGVVVLSYFVLLKGAKI